MKMLISRVVKHLSGATGKKEHLIESIFGGEEKPALQDVGTWAMESSEPYSTGTKPIPLSLKGEPKRFDFLLESRGGRG